VQQARKNLSHQSHGRKKTGKKESRLRRPRKLPKIISLKVVDPKRVKHGIAVYARVLSRSRGTRVVHVVTGVRVKHQLKLRGCSCESRSFRPRTVCIHHLAVAKRLARRRAA
jgi:hypothetical protein